MNLNSKHPYMRTSVRMYACTDNLNDGEKFKEVDIISKNQTRAELIQEQGAIQKELSQAKHRYQRIEQQIKYLQDGERKKRTRRLVIKGAVVEHIAPVVKGMGEREFYELVQRIFDLPEVKAILPKAGE